MKILTFNLAVYSIYFYSLLFEDTILRIYIFVYFFATALTIVFGEHFLFFISPLKPMHLMYEPFFGVCVPSMKIPSCSLLFLFHFLFFLLFPFSLGWLLFAIIFCNQPFLNSFIIAINNSFRGCVYFFNPTLWILI